MLNKLANSLTRHQERAALLAADMLAIALSYLLTYGLLIDGLPASAAPRAVAFDLVLLIGSGMAVIVLQGLHRIRPNAFQMQDLADSAAVAVLIALAGIAGALFLQVGDMPLQLYVVTGMLFLILSVATRLAMRRVFLMSRQPRGLRLPILIYGAGQTGQQLASALATDHDVEPVAFIDDDRRLQGLTIAGLRVHSPAATEELIERHSIKRVVLAMPSVNRSIRMGLTRRMARLGCEVHALPSFAGMVANSATDISDTQPADIDDLLGRARLEEELPGVSGTYSGKQILITGAGGSIGSELCRQLVSCKPSGLILMDHSELALFEIDRELRAMETEIAIVPVLGTVNDKTLVTKAIEDNGVEIVLHAAAYKHVPLVEQNALEGMRNNVLGTKTVADAARGAGVELFILVSTDKAVRPSSIMGASKRFSELVVQDLATRSENTRFSMVRFGNVLGSSGSVIPLFHEQISRGGPVTLTHSDVTRYFMTIPEAVRLVLLAGSFARGGDVFVLDMGKPVPIRDLARKMIESAGYTVRDSDSPDGEIEIEITGLRPGEKLHEELLIGSDMLTTPHPKILRAQENHLSEIEMANALQALRHAIEARNQELLESTLAQWIEKAETANPKSVNE